LKRNNRLLRAAGGPQQKKRGTLTYKKKEN